MKKFISLTLAVFLAFALLTASAQTTESAPAEIAEQLAEKMSVSGVVSEVTDEYIMLGDDELQLNIDESTYICDYDLNPVEVVKKDAQIVAVVSTMTTMSIPAQNYAYYIFVNTNDSAAHPIYALVDTNENGEIMSADGNNKIVYTEETPVIAHKIRIMLKGADITKGSEIVAFASTVGMSLPAHVPAEKIAVLSLAPVAEEVNDNTFTVGDKEFEYADASLFEEASAPRFALRHVLETLGYTVNWNDSDWSIDIAGKTRNIVRIKIGEAMFEGQAKENFPVIVDSTTYVTEELFGLLTPAQ